ncbi:MAG TPA: hypothetical protein VFK30_10865 [Anaerolineae bacterium]|nr:hypothetical protein [Anaerolineae bacterium]
MASSSDPARPIESDKPLVDPALSKILALLGQVVAPSALLTALLFYFGWSYTNALASEFGIDPSVLVFNTGDYLLRSISIASGSLSGLLIGALAAIWANYALRRLLQSKWSTAHSRFALWLAIGIALLGVLLVIVGIAEYSILTVIKIDPWLFPLSWTIGIGLIAYGLNLYTQQLRRKKAQAADQPSWLFDIPPRLRLLTNILVIGLLIVGLFSTVAIYADQSGHQRAQQIAANLSALPSVVVYSQAPLSLEAPGVITGQLTSAEGAYQYRYSGLKFLIRSDNKYFLLPAQWVPVESPTIILPDTEAIRVEVMSGSAGSIP